MLVLNAHSYSLVRSEPIVVLGPTNTNEFTCTRQLHNDQRKGSKKQAVILKRERSKRRKADGQESHINLHASSNQARSSISVTWA